MNEYHKIQSVYKRDEKTHKFLEGQFSLPEFDYLKDNKWVATEKVDGTNIRVIWDGSMVTFGGKTYNAQIPAPLFTRLNAMFNNDQMRKQFGDQPTCLYGEGYGRKIQKVGSLYSPDSVDFILFDVKVGHWWLKREDVEDIAAALGIDIVPVVIKGCKLLDAVDAIRARNLYSKISAEPLLMEGFVLRPKIELFARNGSRIITKIKHVDF